MSKREIKFRSWDGEKMVNVSDIVFSSNKPKAYWKENSVIESSKIIMQFTGLHDKNGKEIYEGDIVKNWQGGWNVVVYKAPAFEATISAEQSSYYSIEWWNEVEVIGNIYENSELL